MPVGPAPRLGRALARPNRDSGPFGEVVSPAHTSTCRFPVATLTIQATGITGSGAKSLPFSLHSGRDRFLRPPRVTSRVSPSRPASLSVRIRARVRPRTGERVTSACPDTPRRSAIPGGAKLPAVLDLSVKGDLILEVLRSPMNHQASFRSRSVKEPLPSIALPPRHASRKSHKILTVSNL